MEISESICVLSNHGYSPIEKQRTRDKRNDVAQLKICIYTTVCYFCGENGFGKLAVKKEPVLLKEATAGLELESTSEGSKTPAGFEVSATGNPKLTAPKVAGAANGAGVEVPELNGVAEAAIEDDAAPKTADSTEADEALVVAAAEENPAPARTAGGEFGENRRTEMS